MGKAYHYVSKKKWDKIKESGFDLYEILAERGNFFKLFPKGIKGIWCWEDRHHTNKISELGSILHQIPHDELREVIEIEITYSSEDVLTYKGNKIPIDHNLVSPTYYLRKPSLVLTNFVPSKNIKKIREINGAELCKKYKDGYSRRY